MKQIVLTIPENKFSFFMELVRNFKFIKIEQTTDVSESEIIEGIRQGLKELQLIEQGKMNATPLRDFLNEL